MTAALLANIAGCPTWSQVSSSCTWSYCFHGKLQVHWFQFDQQCQLFVALDNPLLQINYLMRKSGCALLPTGDPVMYTYWSTCDLVTAGIEHPMHMGKDEKCIQNFCQKTWRDYLRDVDIDGNKIIIKIKN